MKAQATALGHPIHPMLIVFPLGLFPGGGDFRSNLLVRRS
jgi:hypothetical protein